MTHRHTVACPPDCTREVDVDPASVTGSYRIVMRKKYGNRPGDDKPRWWPLVHHAWKAAVNVLTIVGLAWLLKKLGLTPPGVP